MFFAVCDVCSKTFSSKQAVKMHKQRTEKCRDEKPTASQAESCVCLCCSKAFKNKGHLTLHVAKSKQL